VQPARLRSAIQALLGSGSAAWPRLGGLGPGTEAAPDDTPDATSGATV
jgi:hypothetical protein